MTTSTPIPTANQVPASTPTLTPIPTPTLHPKRPSDREGLWAGEVKNPLLANILPTLAMRVEPGENPDVDPWHFEGGPVFGLPAFECIPEPVEGGWRLGDCTRACSHKAECVEDECK